MVDFMEIPMEISWEIPFFLDENWGSMGVL